jgi:hypothetical protein
LNVNRQQEIFRTKEVDIGGGESNALVSRGSLMESWQQWNVQGRTQGFYQFLLTDRERPEGSVNDFGVLPAELSLSATKSLLTSALDAYEDSVAHMADDEIRQVPVAYFIDLCRTASEPIYQHLADITDVSAEDTVTPANQIFSSEVEISSHAIDELFECVDIVDRLLELPGLRAGESYANATPSLRALRETLESIGPKSQTSRASLLEAVLTDQETQHIISGALEGARGSEALGLLRTFEELNRSSPGTWNLSPSQAEIAIEKSHLEGVSHLCKAAGILTRESGPTAHSAISRALALVEPFEVPSVLGAINPEIRLDWKNVVQALGVVGLHQIPPFTRLREDLRKPANLAQLTSEIHLDGKKNL